MNQMYETYSQMLSLQRAGGMYCSKLGSMVIRPCKTVIHHYIHMYVYVQCGTKTVITLDVRLGKAVHFIKKHQTILVGTDGGKIKIHDYESHFDQLQGQFI